MPFVQRNDQGIINGVFSNLQPEVAEEWLAEDDPEVIEASKLPPETQFTPLDFLEKFTDIEQLAVVEATLSSAAVKLWYDKMLAATFVDVSDPRTEAGLEALVSANLITPERKSDILAVV